MGLGLWLNVLRLCLNKAETQNCQINIVCALTTQRVCFWYKIKHFWSPHIFFANDRL